MTSRSLDTRISIARDPCELPGHRYHPTWEVGHMVCLRCGTRAVCPVCAPQQSDTTVDLAFCANHRPKEVES